MTGILAAYHALWFSWHAWRAQVAQERAHWRLDLAMRHRQRAVHHDKKLRGF